MPFQMQVIKPDLVRVRKTGMISRFEFDKYLQAQGGFICARSRIKALTRSERVAEVSCGSCGACVDCPTLLEMLKNQESKMAVVGARGSGSSPTADGSTRGLRKTCRPSSTTTTTCATAFPYVRP